MAKFLNTTGVSYHLEVLIKKTKDRLILVSPYLQFSDRVKEHLSNLNIQKHDIRIIYRENKLQVDENNWLEEQVGIRTSLCKNLHAKCYINESEAIITSMNLYEFSQQNNNEMGIHFTKEEDPELYEDTMAEVQRLLTISDEIRVTVKKVPSESNSNPETKSFERKPQYSNSNQIPMGYCIRTGMSIPFNIDKPLSYPAFQKWNEFGDPDYPEKFCHYSGEKSNGETSVSRPIKRQYWKEAKGIFNF
ncbi:phospholipase D family protein [Litoribacter alkaliphilus]|uniref:Phospholipase D family protein n=1 Tax=Litoribacter ruber TaxID=702568 RepID=A0AAP2CKK3_9BACT|nr:phospholipase D family protein [Litoribacter alkaliphilus]MBS9525857.1 phospholipase D family protein [Litoribacter alkaliphilus]